MSSALQGIKVIDLTHVLAGPYCTMVLADLGADVIKVEPPDGDDSRAFGPFLPDQSGNGTHHSAYFISINRNKRSICLNLKTEEGKALLRDLIAKADVVVENYRPTTMKKLGFSFEEMKKINPGIIYCSICGFGQDALPEFASKPAYDMVAQAYSGLMSITGPLNGAPVRVGSSVGDIVAGHQGVIGILAALRHRDATGEGQHVDISMVDGLVSILENAVVRYTVSGEIPVPLGTAHPSITPFQAFKTKDNSWVITPIGNDSLWSKFCKVLGREDLIEHELYSTNGKRTVNRESLVAIIDVEMMKKTSAEWLEILEAAGLPNSPLNTIDKVVTDKNLLHRGMIVDVDHPGIGTIKMAGSPFKMTKTSGTVRDPAPKLGEHSEEILEEMLGIGASDIADLVRKGVVIAEKKDSK